MPSVAPSAALLAKLDASLERMWRQRSALERRTRTHEVSALSVAPKPAGSRALQRVRIRAALSGCCDPLNLLLKMRVGDPHGLLDSVAASFDRTLTPEGWRWQMRAGPRTSIFRMLKRKGRLARALEDVRAVPTDAAGVWLRRILEDGRVPDPDSFATEGELKPLLQAMNWLRAAERESLRPLPDLLPVRDALRRSLSLRAQGEHCDRLLEKGFYGYERQLERLRKFILESSTDARVPVLPIEGVGGAGKSTLLAALLKKHLRASASSTAPILLQIDFDRLAFRYGGELELSFDVTRQIGLHVPALDAPLAVLRDHARESLHRFGSDAKEGSAMLESIIDSTTFFDSEAGNLMAAHAIGGRPVVLLLDTFEEWRRRGTADRGPSEQQRRLAEWISALRDRMGLTKLRVVVSGRVTLERVAGLFHLRPSVRLTGIGKGSALRLLAKLGFSRAEGRRLLDLLAGSSRRWIPLTLHLAARMLKGLGPDERKGFFSEEGDLQGQLHEELRQGLLYKRYLEHMNGDDVTQVAMPGLALRRVTVPIIRHVLAGPCGLGDVDEARARRLLSELEDQVWLVQREGDALIHRPEIRSMILQLMADDPDHAGTVRALHQAAIRWYREGEGRSEVSEDAARQEALYHELSLLPPGADLPHLSSGSVEKGSRDHFDLRALLPGRDDFPRRLRTQLRFAVEDWIPPDEAANLPMSALPSYVREHGQKLVRRGEATQAVEFFEATPVPEPHWLAQAQVEAVRWSDVSLGSEPYLLRIRKHSPDTLAGLRLKHHVLRAFLADDSEALEQILALLAQVGEAGPNAGAGAGPGNLLDTLYLLLVALGRPRILDAAPALPDYLAGVARTASRGRRAFHDWHRAAVVARALDLDPEAERALTEMPPDTVLAGMLRPNPELLRQYAAFLEESSAPAAAAAVRMFEKRVDKGAAHSAQLLFTWPAETLKAMGTAFGEERALLRLPDRLPLLRVDDPELRPAVRRALASAFDTRADFHRLGMLLAKVLPLRIGDFDPARMASEGWKRRHELRVRLVEFLDRAGVLGDALAATVSHSGPDSALARVRQGYARWDEARNKMLAELPPGRT